MRSDTPANTIKLSKDEMADDREHSPGIAPRRLRPYITTDS